MDNDAFIAFGDFEMTKAGDWFFLKHKDHRDLIKMNRHDLMDLIILAALTQQELKQE